MSKVVLELNEISKVFGNNPVLKKITHQFITGKTYALVGPSGAGKSTMLKIIDFLEEPTTGQVLYNGQSAGKKSDRLIVQRKIGMVFQQPVLFSGTVLDNVFYGLKVRGEKLAPNREKLLDILQKVGLAKMERQKATTLSGGEAQRLALARVMILEPELLLLDEPTANLDPANVKLMESLLQEIKNTGTTIIMVTHNLFQAKRLADEVLFLYEGSLIEAKPVEKMFNSPENELTKAFIKGEMVW